MTPDQESKVLRRMYWQSFLDLPLILYKVIRHPKKAAKMLLAVLLLIRAVKATKKERYEIAIAHYERLLPIFVSLIPKPSQISSFFEDLAELHEKVGNKDKAKEVRQAARKLKSG